MSDEIETSTGVWWEVVAVRAKASVVDEDSVQEMLTKTLSNLTRVGFLCLLVQVYILLGMSMSMSS